MQRWARENLDVIEQGILSTTSYQKIGTGHKGYPDHPHKRTQHKSCQSKTPTNDECFFDILLLIHDVVAEHSPRKTRTSNEQYMKQPSNHQRSNINIMEHNFLHNGCNGNRKGNCLNNCNQFPNTGILPSFIVKLINGSKYMVAA